MQVPLSLLVSCFPVPSSLTAPPFLLLLQDESELDGLNTLFERAERNGVPVEEVTEAQAKELEPLARTHHRALWSPATAAAG